MLKGLGISGIAGVGGYFALDRMTDREDYTGPDSPDPAGTPTAGSPPVRFADQYDTVVEVTSRDVDPTGSEPIGGFLSAHAGDDTLLSFPAGTYRLPSICLRELSNFGISASYDERPRFVGTEEVDPYLRFERVTNFLLDGVDFDFRGERVGGAVNVIAHGDATVRDISIAGSHPDQITMFRMDIRDPNGRGIVERLRAHNPGDATLTGAYVGKDHSGELTFRDCILMGFSDNGLYASAPGVEHGGGGVVHTVGGRFENNNVSNLRLGSTGSSAKGDTIIVDTSPDLESVNLRGIRLRWGHDQLIGDCVIRFGEDAGRSFGGIVFHADNEGAVVEDTTITIDCDRTPGINAFYHSGAATSAPRFSNVTIDGGASHGFAVLIIGRDGTEFRDCTIRQTGKDRSGIRLAYSTDCRIVDSTIEVSKYPLILRDSTATIENTTLITPEGEEYIEEMVAEGADFRPERWAVQ